MAVLMKVQGRRKKGEGGEATKTLPVIYVFDGHRHIKYNAACSVKHSDIHFMTTTKRAGQEFDPSPCSKPRTTNITGATAGFTQQDYSSLGPGRASFSASLSLSICP
ncbi:hypothetical protein PoB_005727000 [Plakobranchus ocellatus]|uniref:Uncharacterized protein n=1 Tax=Plakobranchus ocellatus TaxID=259542 RepID=A0AAV4CGW6_9GAST|nr:hypothetical protein PoB_005727000 [Plakobranchus ocellatus]